MILSIDIGGTAVKMGLVDRSGGIHARHEASVCSDGYRTPILTTVIREAKAFLARENAAVEGVGVSATGQVDDLLGEINKVTADHGRVLVTTLTKRMAESLTQYLREMDV